jgi:hypothetical protein
MTDVLDSVGSVSQNALDTVVGGGAIALDAFRRPSVARRRGERALKQTNQVVEETLALPERALVAYLRNLRRQARRKDVVGAVSRNVLIALNRPAATAARFFHVVERESAVPAAQRGGRRGAASTTGRTNRAVRSTARKAVSAAKTTRRRTTTAARRRSA